MNVAAGFTPTSTPVALAAGDTDERIGAVGAAAVVNVHEYGAAIAWPVPFVAPLTVAVYVVPYARALPGVNVAVLLAES